MLLSLAQQIQHLQQRHRCHHQQREEQQQLRFLAEQWQQPQVEQQQLQGRLLPILTCACGWQEGFVSAVAEATQLQPAVAADHCWSRLFRFACCRWQSYLDLLLECL